MKIINIDLGNEFQEIQIMNLGDIHIGDANFDKKLLEDTIKLIQDTPNMFFTLNGDLINNAVRDSVSDIYSEEMPPQVQLELLIEYFEPIKHKLLGVVQGNHCERTYRQTGIDLTKVFSQSLGLSDRYSPEQLLIYISFGKNRHRESVRHTTSLFLTHVGGTKTRLVNLSDIVDADIFFRGHYHQPQVHKLDIFKTDIRYKTINQHTQIFAQNGGCLTYGGYGATKGFRPSTAVFPIVTVSIVGDKRKEYLNMEVRL